MLEDRNAPKTRTRRQLAKHAQRMRRIGCDMIEIARALEMTVEEVRQLLKEAL